MHIRIFEKDQRAVSEIGLGCWQIGGNWGDVTDATAKGILEASVESGITFLDTADVYGGGRSERLIGEHLKRHPDSAFVATKIGRGTMYPDDYTPAKMEAAVDACLARLQVDCLGLVQLHCIPFPALREAAVWDALRALQAKGKIRQFGASVETMDEALWCVDHVEDLYSLQIIFNMVRQKAIGTLFPKAQAKDVGLIIRVPLASGLLSGQWDAETRFGADDHRNFNKDGAAFNVGETLAGLPFEAGLQVVDALEQLKPAGVPMAQWALRWILDHPAVTTVIPGASKPEQVFANAGASALAPIPEATHRRLQALYESEIAGLIRGPY